MFNVTFKYRIAHVKKCAKEHNVSSLNLMNLIETQAKIAREKQKKGVSHTKYVGIDKVELFGELKSSGFDEIGVLRAVFEGSHKKFLQRFIQSSKSFCKEISAKTFCGNPEVLGLIFG